MIKLIIPEASKVVAMQEELKNSLTMALTPDNIGEVVENRRQYRGYTLVLDGALIHARKFMSAFNNDARKLISIWRLLSLSIFIFIEPDFKPSEGLLSIDKGIRDYIGIMENRRGI